ncbi:transcription repressor NadR [Haploplasma axanthum]|uniref:Probable transcription repressor NiaR n=1 Tax=Haploplasma axanthum TaxID=29552 RepID=A0A449BBP1_HAPAX|nr:transcription repressor NadR [Haploplasma axanthum]VEU79874.1 Probable transcription repressor NiaR [Haploplasma axanthum]
MNGQERRNEILHILNNSKLEVSATSLAKKFAVSRQIIVGDIALLRALGHRITALPKGYIIDSNQSEYNSFNVIVKHTPKETIKELTALVNANVIVLDVTINHPTYGILKGDLNIKTLKDIELFLKNRPNLLSSLTDGVHVHTLLYKDKKDLNAALNALNELGFIYND